MSTIKEEVKLYLSFNYGKLFMNFIVAAFYWNFKIKAD